MKNKIKEIIESIYAIGFSDGFLGEKYHKPKIYFHSDKLVALFQAQHEHDIKAFEELLKKDETAYYDPDDNRIAMWQNQVRAELRTKLDQYKKENI